MKMINTKHIKLLEVGKDADVEVVVTGNNKDGYMVSIIKDDKEMIVRMMTEEKAMKLKQLTSVGHYMEKIGVKQYSIVIK